MNSNKSNQPVYLSSKKIFAACLAVAACMYAIGLFHPFPRWIIAAEVFVTAIMLFVFGSIHWRIHKNALTYGAAFIITSTFWQTWWQSSQIKRSVESNDWPAMWEFIRHYFLTLEGLNKLVHADTMLFILGLTLFVSVIAQTRLLETFSFKVLKMRKGSVLSTIAILAGLVAFSSGILDGVSMIGLMIRTLVIILFLAKAKDEAVLYAVMVSTVITTVCGMWLAYGEPPNLIMKANLDPYLTNGFFLRYCLPIAFGSYCIVVWNLKRKLKGQKVNVEELDILDVHTDDVRFLQAMRHGKVIIPVELIDPFKEQLGSHFEAVNRRLHKGEPLGTALIHEKVSSSLRIEILGELVSEDLAETLDHHYLHVSNRHTQGIDESAQKIRTILRILSHRRLLSQKIGAFSFIPFIGLLITHAFNHNIPLFLASFSGFAIALCGIFKLPNIRRLAIKDAKHEYAEYLFLLPLFFSITLLEKTGLFNQLSGWLHQGIDTLGTGNVSYLQFISTTLLSMVLDNNVVADFISRALHGLEVQLIHLFAMAQIAGYAVGGCWTHIGSAQSVVAYSFIQKEVNRHFTPFQWIKTMTPIIVEILLLITLIIYAESFFIKSQF